jgi:alpha-tubulin suppressor-like RCC1 family protein
VGDEKLVKVVAGENNSGAIVTGRGDGKQIYTWGAGENGQLGDGLCHSHCDPTPVGVGIGESIVKLTAIDLAFGAKHCACVLSDGKVFTFGSNKSGQCGYDDVDLEDDEVSLDWLQMI